MECEACGHQDYDHDGNSGRDVKQFVFGNRSCERCDCKNFVPIRKDFLTLFANMVGYKNRWKFLKNIAVDIAIIYGLFFLIDATYGSTCVVAEGELQLELWNQCVAQHGLSENPFEATSSQRLPLGQSSLLPQSAPV